MRGDFNCSLSIPFLARFCFVDSWNRYRLASRKLSARALCRWKVAGGGPCGRTSRGTGCPAPPAAGGAPPGGPPPPGDPGVPPPGGPDPPPPGGPDPPPPGGPHPEGPPDGGFGGSYFFFPFPNPFSTPFLSSIALSL